MLKLWKAIVIGLKVVQCGLLLHPSMWKGFKLVDYDKDYSDKRNIDDVLEIFDNPDNVQIPNLMMILNHIRYIFCSDKKEQYTELFQHMASLLQQPHKILPVCIFKSKPGLVKT